MKLEILTPEKVLFEGEATSILLPGISGNFELLENHAPIISALEKGTIIVNNNATVTNISIEDGFVECIQNRVVVLIGKGEVQA